MVTKEDIVNYASGKTAGVGGGARPEERVPMTRMRARIAERLMQSKNSIAMLTSFNEVNLAKVMAMRKELGEAFEKANGIKLGFMSFFAKAAANALQKYPVVNASVDGNDVIYHGYADISIAVSTDKGLVTPVAAQRRAPVLRRYRKGHRRLRQEGTRRQARPGRPAGRHLHHHQRRHLRFADVDADRQPAAVGDPGHARHQGTSRSPRTARSSIAPMMYIALSYDHRIIDGKDAVLFLVDIKNQLENPHRMLLGM